MKNDARQTFFTDPPAAYARRVRAAAPPSPLAKNCLLAFLTGGAICSLGQYLLHRYRAMGLSLQDARTAVSLSLILLSAILTALGIYDRIARHAGAGTLVPITGFANSMVSPAMEFRSEGLVTGLGAKMFVVSGPVLVYGLAASVLFGLLLWALSLAGVQPL